MQVVRRVKMEEAMVPLMRLLHPARSRPRNPPLAEEYSGSSAGDLMRRFLAEDASGAEFMPPRGLPSSIRW